MEILRVEKLCKVYGEREPDPGKFGKKTAACPEKCELFHEKRRVCSSDWRVRFW